jgi:hypothetical protein
MWDIVGLYRRENVSVEEIHTQLRNLANAEKAKILRGFFKTGPEEYREGDGSPEGKRKQYLNGEI